MGNKTIIGTQKSVYGDSKSGKLERSMLFVLLLLLPLACAQSDVHVSLTLNGTATTTTTTTTTLDNHGAPSAGIGGLAQLCLSGSTYVPCTTLSEPITPIPQDTLEYVQAYREVYGREPPKKPTYIAFIMFATTVLLGGIYILLNRPVPEDSLEEEETLGLWARIKCLWARIKSKPKKDTEAIMRDEPGL